jgi:hypothetical protein
MFCVRNDPLYRTVYTRLTGLISRPEIDAWGREYRQVTDSYAGKRHLVYADMRGLVPLDGECARVFSDVITYARRRGVRACVHLSDSTIQRLQAARLARDASPDDDVTIDVDSETEAEGVLATAFIALVENWSWSRQDVLDRRARETVVPT